MTPADATTDQLARDRAAVRERWPGVRLACLSGQHQPYSLWSDDPLASGARVTGWHATEAAAWADARKRLSDELDRCVEAVLMLAKQPINIREVEHILIKVDRYADTFDVRDSVHRLVNSGRAKFTPNYCVELVQY